MVNVLFITVVDITKPAETYYPPLGLAYLASYAKKQFPHTMNFKIIDRDVEKTIKEFKPDIIGINVISQNYDKAKRLSKLIKNKYNIPIIIGGIHISMLKESMTKDFDVGIIGEAEATFTDFLLQFMIDNHKIIIKNYLNMPGLLLHQNNKLHYTGDRDLIENINDIPFPDRSLLEIDSYDTNMFSSRGCPFNCCFCASTRFWKTTRFHSAKYVADEIEHVYKTYGCKSITFSDDLFIAKIDRLKDIIDILREKNLLGKIEFLVNCRANLINQRLLNILKELNVVSIGMGIESGSSKILKYLKGGNVTVDMNKNAINLVTENGIRCAGSFVIGCPIETEETIEETYQFIKQSKLDTFGVYILTPFVGTPMWDYAEKKGLVSSDMDFSILDVTNINIVDPQSIILCENISKERLQHHMYMFNRLSKKRAVLNVVKTSVNNPERVVKLLMKKLKQMRK